MLTEKDLYLPQNLILRVLAAKNKENNYLFNEFNLLSRSMFPNSDLRSCLYAINRGSQLAVNERVKNMYFSEYTEDDLFEIALKNTRKMMPDNFGLLYEGVGIPMYFVSSKQRDYGAACLLFPELFKIICEKNGHNDLFIIPSSIHECIAVPANLIRDFHCPLNVIIHAVNNECVNYPDLQLTP